MTASWIKYGVAVMAVAVATLIRWLMEPLLGDSGPMSTYIVAVVFVAWYGGFRPALLATILGFAAGLLLFILPRYSVMDTSIPAVTRFTGYFVINLSIAVCAEVLHRTHRRSVQAEQLTRQQAETLRITFASIEDAVITTDVHGKVTYLNKVAQHLTGCTLLEASGKSLSGVYQTIVDPPLSTPNGDGNLTSSETVSNGTGHTILISRDGLERVIDPTISTIRNDAGHEAGQIIIFHDITDRKQAVDLLNRSQAILAQELADMTSLHKLVSRLVVCPDLQSALNEVLSATITMLKADLGNLVLLDPQTGHPAIVSEVGFGKEFVDYFDRVGAPQGTACRRCLDTGHRVVIEDVLEEPGYESLREIALKKGYRAVQSTPLMSRNGTPLGVLSTHYQQPHHPTERDLRFLDLYARQATDFIERTHYQSALRQSEARYRAIGEAIDFGVWMCDAEGQHTYASDSFLILLGVTLPQWAAKGWECRLHPDDIEQTRNEWDDCVRVRDVWDREIRCRGADGGWHDILARGVRVKNEEGQTVGWVGINLDISRLKQAEQSLKEADRRKDEFLATLAHELRNPLAPMRNAIQMLQMKQASPDSLLDASRVIDRQIQQMARLIDDLLDVSRISRNKLELRKEPVELSKVIESALEATQPLMDEQGHGLTVELPEEPLCLDADLTRLAQVFLNLLNNAAKYTERGGRIALRAERQGSDVVVSVTDNGIGIPVDKLPTLFQMFSQVEETISRSQGGLGIGLALVKRLVEMHGGIIEVHSDGPGTGSEFQVRLPLIVNNPGVMKPVNEQFESKTTPSGMRILVVDDNLDAANTMSMILRLMGNQVRTVHDGEAAVKAAELDPPEVILLDIGLPKLNGYEVAEYIRQQSWGHSIFLVAVTGWGQEDDKRRAKDAGFNRHLVKPVDPRTIMQILSELQPAQA